MPLSAACHRDKWISYAHTMMPLSGEHNHRERSICKRQSSRKQQHDTMFPIVPTRKALSGSGGCSSKKELVLRLEQQSMLALHASIEHDAHFPSMDALLRQLAFARTIFYFPKECQSPGSPTQSSCRSSGIRLE